MPIDGGRSRASWTVECVATARSAGQSWTGRRSAPGASNGPQPRGQDGRWRCGARPRCRAVAGVIRGGTGIGRRRRRHTWPERRQELGRRGRRVFASGVRGLVDPYAMPVNVDIVRPADGYRISIRSAVVVGSPRCVWTVTIGPPLLSLGVHSRGPYVEQISGVCHVTGPIDLPGADEWPSPSPWDRLPLVPRQSSEAEAANAAQGPVGPRPSGLCVDDRAEV